MKRRISELTKDLLGTEPVILEKTGLNGLLSTNKKLKVNLIALGDVGTNVLLGLKLLGGDLIEEVGIFDLNKAQLERLEMEFNQMHYPPAKDGPMKTMPRIKIIEEEEIPLCDLIIFCATKGVPQIGASGDMRMMQLEANLGLVFQIGSKIKAHNDANMDNPEAYFDGMIAVVSDPVDQLCKGMLKATGLQPGQIRGFGLGVMAARARYYAGKDEKFSSYLTEGRGFGPHGQDLVIANSIENYDDALSRELTKLTVEANMRVRDLGFKPFLAPAISSAALSILATLRGEWNYGSVYFGSEEEGAYLGILSRLTEEGVEYEDLELPEELYQRIKTAYGNLLK